MIILMSEFRPGRGPGSGRPRGGGRRSARAGRGGREPSRRGAVRPDNRRSRPIRVPARRGPGPGRDPPLAAGGAGRPAGGDGGPRGGRRTRGRGVRGHGRPLRRGEREPAPGDRALRPGPGGKAPARRGVQAAHEPLQLPGTGASRTAPAGPGQSRDRASHRHRGAGRAQPRPGRGGTPTSSRSATRNMHNAGLLRKAARTGKPILLKRGMAATLEELLMAAEYVLAEGNRNVILCERGIRTFSRHSRYTLDLLGDPRGARGQPPAHRGGPQPRHRQARPGAAHGPRGPGRRRRRPAARGPPEPRALALGRAAGAAARQFALLMQELPRSRPPWIGGARSRGDPLPGETCG